MPQSSRLQLPPAPLTDDLAYRWPRLNLVERGDELEKILALGFSRRAVALALGWSEGTVRRNLRLAKLPASTRAAIAGGCSAKRVLSAERRGEPLPTIDATAAQCALDQHLLDRFMEQAGPWLNRHIPWPAYQEQFLVEADRRLWRLPPSERQPTHPASPRCEIKRHRPRRRTPSYGPDLMEHLLEWFLHWADQILTSRQLRNQLLTRLGQRIAESSKSDRKKKITFPTDDVPESSYTRHK